MVVKYVITYPNQSSDERPPFCPTLNSLSVYRIGVETVYVFPFLLKFPPRVIENIQFVLATVRQLNFGFPQKSGVQFLSKCLQIRSPIEVRIVDPI